jgi:hypothetical protein
MSEQSVGFYVLIFVPMLAFLIGLIIYETGNAKKKPWTKSSVAIHAVLAFLVTACGIGGVTMGFSAFVMYTIIGLVYLYVIVGSIKYIKK